MSVETKLLIYLKLSSYQEVTQSQNLHFENNHCKIWTVLSWDQWVKTFYCLAMFLWVTSPWSLLQYRMISETRLNLKSSKSHLPITYLPTAQSFWNFAQSMAVTLPCSVQNFKMIGQKKSLLLIEEFRQDLSFKTNYEGYSPLLVVSAQLGALILG